MNIVLKIIFILVGLELIHIVLKTLKSKKMSAGQSLLWILAGLLIIIVSIFPGIIKWISELVGIWWSPAVVLFAAVIILGFINFNHSKEISIMRAQITELSEQLSVVKHELKMQGIINEETREE